MLHIADTGNPAALVGAGFSTLTLSRCGEFFTLVDDDMRPYLAHFTWSLHRPNHLKLYARAERCPMTGGRLRLYLHHLVADVNGIKPQHPGETHLDHKDGNGLNNRKCNLIWRTPLQNRFGTARGWPPP